MAGGKRVVRRKKKKRDPNAPKRPRSAYILFCSHQREAVKAQQPGAKPSDLMRALGALWKSMNDDQKVHYNKRAEEDKHRYNTEMQSYTPPDESSDSDSDAPRRRKKKKKKDPNAPKRAMSAYLFFGMQQRPIIKAQNPHLRSHEIMKQIADLWRNLPAHAKIEFDRKAEEDKRRYMEAIQNYKNSLKQQESEEEEEEADSDSEESDSESD
jgi:HMG (high mobility group) box